MTQVICDHNRRKRVIITIPKHYTIRQLMALLGDKRLRWVEK
jgi:hypothetical protein